MVPLLRAFFAIGWEISAAEAGAESGFEQIEEGKFVFFIWKFLGFLKLRLLKWTLLIKSFWIVEYGQIHGVNLCAFFMALWK